MLAWSNTTATERVREQVCHPATKLYFYLGTKLGFNLEQSMTTWALVAHALASNSSGRRFSSIVVPSWLLCGFKYSPLMRSVPPQGVYIFLRTCTTGIYYGPHPRAPSATQLHSDLSCCVPLAGNVMCVARHPAGQGTHVCAT